ncbi:MAG: T9SS type A sorting domain-containing protein [Flavobacteriales bacterium]
MSQISIKPGTSVIISPNTTISFSPNSVGIIQIDSNTVVVNDGIIELSENNVVQEFPGFPIVGLGYEFCERNISQPVSNENLNGLGFVITSNLPLGQTLIKRGHSNIHQNLNSVNRWFEIIPANQEIIDIEFIYDTTELNSINPEDLKVIFTPTLNSIWTNLGGLSNPFQNNVNTVSTDSIGFFTLSPLSIDLVQINSDTFCVGSPIIIDFEVTGLLNQGNLFILELSDENGSFTNPTSLDTISGLLSSIFNTLIPNGLATSSNYQIRVRTTDVQEYFMLKDITISAIPFITLSSNSSSLCINSEPEELIFSPSGGTLSGDFLSGNYFNPQISGIGTFNFSYDYTNDFGCSNTINYQIDVFSTPVLSFNLAQDSICESASPVPLSASPANGQFWGIGVVSTEFYPSISSGGSHNIFYSYTDLNGCSDTIVTEIFVRDKPISEINGLDSSYCENDNPVQISLNPSGGVLNGPGILFSNEFHPLVADIGSHSITYYVEDIFGCHNTDSVIIDVYPSPNQPTISQNGNLLASSTTGDLQWYFNGNALAGETGQFLNALQSGFYSVEIVNSYGCSNSSALYNFVYNSIDEQLTAKIRIYPNPTKDFLFVDFDMTLNDDFFLMDIIDISGKKIKSQQIRKIGLTSIDVSRFVPGVYFMNLIGESGQNITFKFVVN